MSEPLYLGAAVGYDELFARATRLFIPTLLRAAHLAPGQIIWMSPPEPVPQLRPQLKSSVAPAP